MLFLQALFCGVSAGRARRAFLPRAPLLLLCFVLAPAAWAEGPRTLLIFGDSLSAAYGLETRQGWVARLAAGLPPDVKLINASISGETTSGGLSRLPGLLATHRPAWVVLELGANDGLRGLPPRRIEDNIDRLLGMIRTSGAQALLVGIQLPPNYGPLYGQGFAQMFPRLARAHNVPLVPFLLEGVADRPEWMQPDGLHPNAQGQERVLDNVRPVLAPLLMSPPDRAP